MPCVFATAAIFVLIGEDAVPVYDQVASQVSRGGRIVGRITPLHVGIVHCRLLKRAPPPSKRLARRTQCPSSSSGFAAEGPPAR